MFSNPISIKRFGKQDRERRVLLGLIENYIKTGKPVGSNTLKEAGFEELSSATLRNYFANLEESGFLTQSHSSGGRIPTNAAYRLYAGACLESPLEDTEKNPFKSLEEFDSREIAALLQESADLLAKTTNCAVFLSAPRFDHDFVVDLKVVPIDTRRCLCVLITDFGVIQTEVLQLPIKLSSFSIKRIESYFYWRLTGLNKPVYLDAEEEAIAQTFYNEIMVRYIVGYSNFIDEEIYRTGFSRLLVYPEFQDAALLASSLSLFENAHAMRLLLKECSSLNHIKYWIGEDLLSHTATVPNCAVLAIPYYINKTVVGSVGILGPTRMPYQMLFKHLEQFSHAVSEAITRNIYKFKITYRQPKSGSLYIKQEEHHAIGQSRLMLLEDKTKKY